MVREEMKNKRTSWVVKRREEKAAGWRLRMKGRENDLLSEVS